MVPGYHPAADWSNDRRSSSTHLPEGNTGQCSNRWPSDSPAAAANPDAHLTLQVAVPSLASKENCIANPQAKRPGKYGFGERLPVPTSSRRFDFRHENLGMEISRVICTYR